MNRNALTLIKALSFGSLISFGLGGCGSPEGDLNNFCTIVEEVMADDSRKGSKKDIAIFKKVSMGLRTKEGKDILLNLDKISPKERYNTLLQGANKLGIKGYKCAAAETWFKTQKK